jgi:hypothetical protein
MRQADRECGEREWRRGEEGKLERGEKEDEAGCGWVGGRGRGGERIT